MEHDAITRATFSVTTDDVERMLLSKGQLPPGASGFAVVREGELNNAAMAELPMSGHTAEELRGLGRVTGFQREWVTSTPEAELHDGADLALATVAHVMESPEAVSHWMVKVFLEEFEAKVGEGPAPGHRLLSVERLTLDGAFHHEAVALRAMQEAPMGVVSSTVIDFRVGRLLGVVYVVSVGDQRRQELTQSLGKALEQRMIAVALGVA